MQPRLPQIRTPEDLAMAMGITYAQLHWLTHATVGVSPVFYNRFKVKKKLGGSRSISSPIPLLRTAQQWIYERILLLVPVSSCAHGFVRKRSTRTNALPHVGRAIVANVDLKDFFPSIGLERVRGYFRALGYEEPVAGLLAYLTTEESSEESEGNQKPRRLPQGACTSPAITNGLCRALDARLAGLAHGHRFRYTRYADDMTFSGDDSDVMVWVLHTVRRIVEEEGFVVNETKTTVMHPGMQQRVTGVVVNERTTLAKSELRELRAILHNCKRNGWKRENATRKLPNFPAWLRGRVSLAVMLDPSRAKKMQSQLAEALRRA